MKFYKRIACILALLTASTAFGQSAHVDLLVVGGTESGCAAAIQAARMGVQSIILVNDTPWLGGQFSSEALAAIDENRGPAGYDQTVPFPRSGLFKEAIDRMEARNTARYGEPRPGNTRVITTSRPIDSAHVFTEMLQPYIESGQVEIRTPWFVQSAKVTDNIVESVTFVSTTDSARTMTIAAALTIDASDWGDVIKVSGAAYEFGPDLQETYGEPLAPTSRTGYPLTDMNPLTYCMVIEETDRYEPIPKPANYDPRNYRDHGYPKDPLWLYPTRRIIDRYNFEAITHPDVLLLCFPAFDYPVDVWPAQVAQALEATETGASKKNIAELTHAQRQIVYEDAKRYSLGFLYYLQTEVHDAMENTTHSFRRFKLSEEFGTADNLPPKPYLRESLRTKAMYMTRQQDTTGHGGRATHFATVMFHDGLVSWQFEYDFHPTGRRFLEDPSGPWLNYFRDGRTWGPPYSGKSNFPLRSFVPEKIDGLIVAQKNLGYTSLVGSALRLHDQSMAVGQAAGAIAATVITEKTSPRELPYDRARLLALQEALCSSIDQGTPASIWPFSDIAPHHPAYTAANMLAITGALPQDPRETSFDADQPAAEDWRDEVIERSLAIREYTELPQLNNAPATRGEFAVAWWNTIRALPLKPYTRATPDDADADGIPDHEDALLFSAAKSSWPEYKPNAQEDGLPDPDQSGRIIRRINFTAPGASNVEDFENDTGDPYDAARGYGWREAQGGNHRVRGQLPEAIRDSFQFTRSHAQWECALPNGDYEVTVCIGDSGHEQEGQHLAIEGTYVIENADTITGFFHEFSGQVKVDDGRLTIQIGKPGSTTNTCINWLQISQP